MKTGWKNNIHTLIATILNLILPRACAGCRKSNESFCENCQALSYKYGAHCLICGFRNNDGKICPACHTWKLGFQMETEFPRALKNVLWAGKYDGALREAVRQFKYRRRKELAEPLAQMLIKKFYEIHLTLQKDNFLIIPMPLHFKKEYERRFNQAELLAQKFSEVSGIEIKNNVLTKIKETPAQVEVKDKEKRIKNLEGAFSVAENVPSFTKHKTIILIDDVSTTGATLIHAARTLEQSGAEKIIGLVAAHGA